jgi:nitroreductase
MKALSKILKIIILLVSLSIIILTSGKIAGVSFNKDEDSNRVMSSTEELFFFRNNFPQFSYSEYDTLLNSFVLYDTTNTIFCKILFTSPLCKNIVGYVGEIPLAIMLNNEEKIEKIFALDNSETPEWFEKLHRNNLFGQWNGLSVDSAINKSVDAISGATFSSSAVIQSVQKTLENYACLQTTKSTYNSLNIIGLILSFIVLLFAILQFFTNNANTITRLILLFACAVIIGFWHGDVLNIYLLHNWLIDGVNIYERLFLFLVLLIAISLPLFTNRNFYCYYLCPFGACQELIGKINPRKINLGTAAINILSMIRYVILIISFVFILLSTDYIIYLEPFAAFKYSVASLSTLILAIVMLFLSIFISRPWCRFLCPTGALISMFTGPKMKLKINIKAKNIFPLLSALFLTISVVLAILLFNKNENKVEVAKRKVENLTNNALDNIFERKSVREYTSQSISKDTLEKLVKAGMAAPSARNLQPWYFIVITNKTDLQNLCLELPNASMLKNASAAIVVCGNTAKSINDIDSTYWVQDCCAASENILLAAEAMKLGAVWTAVYPYPDRLKTVCEYLKLPSNIKPLNIIPIGYPAKKEPPKNKWNPNNIAWF